MNIQRLKKIVILYVALFTFLLVFVPVNNFFKGDEYDLSGDVLLEEDVYINYGISFVFIGDTGYSDFGGTLMKVSTDGTPKKHRFVGAFVHEVNYFILISELIALTVVFAGAAFVLCKKE